jgi:hypothetical protein
MPYDYKGAIHVHSTFSDGTGSVEEIMKAANEAALDFVVLSDHNQMRAAAEGLDRWHDSALLITAAEITPEHAPNHYLAFGLPNDAPFADLRTKPPQQVIDAVNRLGGFGVLSHPDHAGTERFGIPSYGWKDWSVKGYAGMGIWDLMTDWQSVLDEWTGGMEVYDEFARHVRGPREETLKRWDELNKEGRVIGYGEIDNHAALRKFEGRELVVFPYAEAFKTVTNRVVLPKPLPKDPAQAKATILAALKQGSFYVAFEYYDDAADFQFEASDGDKTVSMGGELNPTEDCEMFIKVPSLSIVKFLCDGEVLWEEEIEEDRLVEIEQPGTYRVEAYRDGMVWILSNPIFVRAE